MPRPKQLTTAVADSPIVCGSRRVRRLQVPPTAPNCFLKPASSPALKPAAPVQGTFLSACCRQLS